MVRWAAALAVANRGCERRASVTQVAMRNCLARAVLHSDQKTASNWRVCILQPDQDAVGQAATACLGDLSQLRLCVKVLRTTEV